MVSSWKTPCPGTPCPLFITQERTGVVLKADRCGSLRQTACRFWGTFPRKALGVLFFWNRFIFRTIGARGSSVATAPRPALQRVIGAQHSFDRQLPDTSHLTRVHSCGKFAAVQRGVCLYAWADTSRAVSTCMPGQQHGSTAALGHSLGFIAVSAGVRSV